jgi:hypothetical protein
MTPDQAPETDPPVDDADADAVAAREPEDPVNDTERRYGESESPA